MFWNAGTEPPDAQAGIIFHELSHFTDVGDTRDHSYGLDNARELADDGGGIAINNADNVEYFMEEFLR
jgi:hypothetical protein